MVPKTTPKLEDSLGGATHCCRFVIREFVIDSSFGFRHSSFHLIGDQLADLVAGEIQGAVGLCGHIAQFRVRLL